MQENLCKVQEFMWGDLCKVMQAGYYMKVIHAGCRVAGAVYGVLSCAAE